MHCPRLFLGPGPTPPPYPLVVAQHSALSLAAGILVIGELSCMILHSVLTHRAVWAMLCAFPAPSLNPSSPPHWIASTDLARSSTPPSGIRASCTVCSPPWIPYPKQVSTLCPSSILTCLLILSHTPTTTQRRILRSPLRHSFFFNDRDTHPQHTGIIGPLTIRIHVHVGQQDHLPRTSHGRSSCRGCSS